MKRSVLLALLGLVEADPTKAVTAQTSIARTTHRNETLGNV